MDINENNFNVESLKDMLQGKHTSQTKIQVGYKSDGEPAPIRSVGERWFDADGFEWEQKQGYAAKLGKEWQQELHKERNTFKNCSKEVCTCEFPNRLDKKMQASHGMCFDCVIEMEHKLRIQGKYKEYEQEKLKQNALAWLKQAEQDKDAVIEELSRSLTFVTSDGDVEKWKNTVDPEELKNKIEEQFLTFKEEILSKFEVDT
jgi:hypothetical protein